MDRYHVVRSCTFNYQHTLVIIKRFVCFSVHNNCGAERLKLSLKLERKCQVHVRFIELAVGCSAVISAVTDVNADYNTAQRISESHKKYAVEHPEAFDEEFRESCARPGEKNGMCGKSGENAINGRSVYMLDDNKNVIKIFSSVTEAIKFLHTKAHSALCKACRNGTKYKGYYWAKEWVKTFEEKEDD